MGLDRVTVSLEKGRERDQRTGLYSVKTRVRPLGRLIQKKTTKDDGDTLQGEDFGGPNLHLGT